MLYSEFEGMGLVYNHQRYKPLIISHVPPQTHDAYELIYVKAGDIIYLVEEKSYRIGNHSLILTRPGKLHSLHFRDQEEYDRYDVFFGGDAVYPQALSGIPDGLDVIAFGEDNVVLQLFQKMERYCEHFDGAELEAVITDLVEQIIYEILIFLRQDGVKQTNRHTVNPTVAAALEYIDSHLAKNINLDMLCKELYISKSYLHQLFMRHLQTSPRRYIVGKQLLAAQQAIRSGERPTDIYTQYGFSEYSSFYRAYHKLFGYAPSEEGSHRAIQKIKF